MLEIIRRKKRNSTQSYKRQNQTTVTTAITTITAGKQNYTTLISNSLTFHMPTYSSLQILYLVFQFLSISLTLLLIIIVLRSKNFHSKWTLIQICISVLGYSLSAIPSLLVYGDRIESDAFITPLCIIQYKFALFFFYPLVMFPAVLAYYLWITVRHGSNRKEHDTLRWFSMGIWGWSLIYSIAVLLATRKEKQLGVMVTYLYCKCADLEGRWYVYYVYVIIVAGMSLINLCFGGKSIYILYIRWHFFKSQPNRHTAINLGHAVRMAIYIVLLLLLMLTYFLSDLFTPRANYVDTTWTDSTIYVGDFTSALSGTLLFLVFGTTRSATLFLPCCYYSPPETLIHHTHNNNNNNNNNNNDMNLKVMKDYKICDEQMSNEPCGELKEDRAEKGSCREKKGDGRSEGTTNNGVDKKWLTSTSRPRKKINSVTSVTNMPNTDFVKVTSNKDHGDENKAEGDDHSMRDNMIIIGDDENDRNDSIGNVTFQDQK